VQEPGRLTVLKVELVEVHAFHQVTQGLRFERGEARIANPPGRERDRDGDRETETKRDREGHTHKIGGGIRHR